MRTVTLTIKAKSALKKETVKCVIAKKGPIVQVFVDDELWGTGKWIENGSYVLFEHERNLNPYIIDSVDEALRVRLGCTPEDIDLHHPGELKLSAMSGIDTGYERYASSSYGGRY